MNAYESLIDLIRDTIITALIGLAVGCLIVASVLSIQARNIDTATWRVWTAQHCKITGNTTTPGDDMRTGATTAGHVAIVPGTPDAEYIRYACDDGAVYQARAFAPPAAFIEAHADMIATNEAAARHMLFHPFSSGL